MPACCRPQNSAHWPTRSPGICGSIHTPFVLLGMTSIFPANCGTQKLWITPADCSVRKIGEGSAGSLTGTCSSLAVTIPCSAAVHWTCGFRVLGGPICEIAEVTAQLLEREGKAQDPFHLLDAQLPQGARLAQSVHGVTERPQGFVDGLEGRRRQASADGAESSVARAGSSAVFAKSTVGSAVDAEALYPPRWRREKSAFKIPIHLSWPGLVGTGWTEPVPFLRPPLSYQAREQSSAARPPIPTSPVI
jgi:hypothetical protein